MVLNLPTINDEFGIDSHPGIFAASREKEKSGHRRGRRQNICQDKRGTKDSRDSPSFIFQRGLFSSSLVILLLVSLLSSFSLNVHRPRGSVFSSAFSLDFSFFSPSSACFSLSGRRNCRYQTLVCALITPRTSFLLRSSRLTTISSIAAMKRIGEQKGRGAGLSLCRSLLPRVSRSRFR